MASREDGPHPSRVALSVYQVMTTIIAQQDPWNPYENQGKGKGNPHNVVPEPGAYGILFLILALALVMGMRAQRKR